MVLFYLKKGGAVKGGGKMSNRGAMNKTHPVPPILAVEGDGAR